MATVHFSDRELSRFANPEMGPFLEQVRAAGGGIPLRITSGDRTPSDSVRVGGVAGGCHEQGMAADVVPLTDDRDAWASRISAAIDNGSVRVGEFIWYPFDGHAHITLCPCGGTNERLVKTGAETGFTSLVAWLSLGGRARSPAVVAVLLILVILLVRF